MAIRGKCGSFAVNCNAHVCFSFLINRMSFEQLKDRKWHHICVTWSGESGVVIQYLDGIKRASGKGLVWEYEGGGSLKLGASTSFPYHLSGFNLWDKVLNNEEIKDLAGGCLRGIGNVKNWQDFKQAAQANRGLTVVSPTVCRSHEQEEATADYRLSYFPPPVNNGTRPAAHGAPNEPTDEPEEITVPNPPPLSNGMK